jgi:hypothetical protein
MSPLPYLNQSFHPCQLECASIFLLHREKEEQETGEEGKNSGCCVETVPERSESQKLPQNNVPDPNFLTKENGKSCDTIPLRQACQFFEGQIQAGFRSRMK